MRLLLSLVLSLAAVVNAQSCPPRPVIVDVLDAHGSPITNLTSANFIASHKDQPLSISSASFRTDPSVRTVVLLNDVARSKIAKAAALEFISTAPPEAPISMFTFSTAIERRFNSSDGRKPMEDWLNGNQNTTPSHKGSSDLTQTLLTIVKAMEPVHVGDAIYVITGDLDPLFSATGTKEVPAIAPDLARELRSSGVRLFALVLEVVPRTAWNVVLPDDNMIKIPYTPTGSAELANLIRGSGGLALNWYPSEKSRSFASSFDYDDATKAAIRESSRGFQAAISNFYILTVAPPEHSSVPEDWKLEAVNSQGKKLKGITLAYPGKIVGCAATGP
jgi:hypothetical protein